MAIMDGSVISLEDQAQVKSILIVEDDVSLRFALAEWFRLSGYTVYEAATADEAALLLASSVLIHFVITDIDMPGTLNGLDLVEHIGAAFPHIYVIVVSGQVRKIANSTVTFFGKPYDLQAISSFIADL